MKVLIVFSVVFSFAVFGQEENEILRVSALRSRFDKIMDVKVFPNPTSDGRVTIQGNPGTSYHIFNLSGAEIKSGLMEQESVSLDDINTGTYILVLQLDGLERHEKLVIL